jgi:carbonic anhydrase
MESYKKLLLANEAWVQQKLSAAPDFFTDLAKEQKPEFLWIGCSDSRVPAEEVTGTQPGEIFTHRNIANLVNPTDINLSSVLSYAVEFLKVKHVIVCGHYGCGGVRAALSRHRYGILDEWLKQIKDTFVMHEDEILDVGGFDAQADRLVELNIHEQLRNLAKTKVIQKAWIEERRPVLHGWVYGLSDGRIKQLYKIEPGANLHEIYQFDFG